MVIYGARQVGKTTFVRKLLEPFSHEAIYLNADEPDVRAALSGKTSTELKAFLGNPKIVCIDEAQRITDVGLTLKLLVDNYPDMQIMATGSSSFELADRITEPLTGRHYEFLLHPLSYVELASVYAPQEQARLLPQRLIYGSYPEVVVGAPAPAETVSLLAKNYVFKDVLHLDRVRNIEALERLLRALALQIGSQVSYAELAGTLGIDRQTVERYVQVLEQAFIIFRVPSFAKNMRTELRKTRKIYFRDVGIRNALINNLNMPELRADMGALWENYIIAERLKLLDNTGLRRGSYFWRTHAQQEIDYLEEEGGNLYAFECKWSGGGSATYVPPRAFSEAYPNAKVSLIHSQNYASFLTDVGALA